MTTILLTRHGETDWNRDSRWQGHADPPLNERGRAQARALADSLEGSALVAVYSSDLARAWQTAEIVAARYGLQVVGEPLLREVDVGEWSGLTTSEIEHRFPEGLARWRSHLGTGWEQGESYEAMARRAVAGLHAIAARHPGGEVLAVTHGGPIRALQACARDVDPLEIRRAIPVVANCNLVRLAVEEGRVRELEV